GLDEVLGVIVGGLPQRLIAAAVFGVVADEGEQDLGVANASGLLDVDETHIVVAHLRHHGPLVRLGRPRLLDVAGFGGEVEVLARPRLERDRLLCGEGGEAADQVPFNGLQLRRIDAGEQAHAASSSTAGSSSTASSSASTSLSFMLAARFRAL